MAAITNSERTSAMTAEQAAAELAKAMYDLRKQTIAASEYRSIVRELRSSFTPDEWQRITFAAVARLA